MKIISVLLTFFFGFFCSYADARPCNSLRAVDWLLGSWRGTDGNNVIIESWQKVSPLTYEGLGETRSKASNALKGSESMRLVEMSNHVFYLAKVRHNELAVAFKLTRCSKRSAVFENPEHDFPQKLHYQLQGEHKLTVTVSNGKDEGFTINLDKRDVR
ncbi:DUF6265 family protein [Thalassomonas haliotis]|uniref:DUF6265 domain-containing protein n=1 Tax=Thalassomonas haliotis TaxID=485448 RepID=A0ABY7VJW3_9GAMM|nr:DUF6265 family protein [Thalassomonas haliotis]WDE14024.1 hypothetical protein H3N35_11610 [Thalassomonas haliotis]